MGSTDIARYRQAAENARKMAARASDSKIREAYADIAAQYDQLIDEASRASARKR